jgi:hypothetical protein
MKPILSAPLLPQKGFIMIRPWLVLAPMSYPLSLALGLSDQRTVHPVPKGDAWATRDGCLPGLIHITRPDLKHRTPHVATAHTDALCSMALGRPMIRIGCLVPRRFLGGMAGCFVFLTVP